jgi:hypothetical protein
MDDKQLALQAELIRSATEIVKAWLSGGAPLIWHYHSGNVDELNRLKESMKSMGDRSHVFVPTTDRAEVMAPHSAVADAQLFLRRQWESCICGASEKVYLGAGAGREGCAGKYADVVCDKPPGHVGKHKATKPDGGVAEWEDEKR